MLSKLKIPVALFCAGILTGCGDEELATVWGSSTTAPDTTATDTGNGTDSEIDPTGIIQLTTEPDNSNGSISDISRISGDGSKVIFTSSVDYTGQNSDNSSELFIIDADGTGLTQLTASTTGNVEVYGSDLSSDGSVIVFVSTADYLGSNSDNSREVYIVNADGSGLAQLSDDPDRNSREASITTDGQKIMFRSLADPLGTNPNHYTQFFTVNSDGSNLQQVTLFDFETYASGMISGDGTKIVFTSAGDVMGTGTNTDNSNEIFVINADGSGQNQLTDSSGDSETPRISADGSKIAFTSTGDLISGQNTDLHIDVFMINSDGSNLTQITQAPSPFNAGGGGIDFSDDGSTVVFTSNDDLANENPTYKTMVYAYKNGTIVQVNPEHSVNTSTTDPSVSSDGSRVTFASRVDYTGENPAGTDEYYIAVQY